METRGNRFKLITSYILCITVFFVLSIYFYKLILNVNYYYLFIVIPILFLTASSGIFNMIKLILSLISILFDKNDNDEIPRFLNKVIYDINQLYKYTLIGIFVTLLSSVMCLDIILCLSYEKYILLSISIVIWILLYYIIFIIIIQVIKKELNL